MFRMNQNPQEEIEEIKEEEYDYVNVPACTVAKMAARPDQRFRCFPQYFLSIAVCWLILLVIMGLRIHFTNRNLNDKFCILENLITDVTAANQELETQNQELETRNHELETRNMKMETRNREMETRKKEMETRNQELETRNQELERNNLRGQIQNISGTQWSIDEYCPRVNNVVEKRCGSCQEGWRFIIKSSCYLMNNDGRSRYDLKTWEEAREDCRGRSSDLAVVDDEDEKDALGYFRLSTHWFWIGLRAEGGRWKWSDGSDPTESFSDWLHEQPNATDGQCIVYDTPRWRSVSCAERRPWICKKKVLSV